jgi:broad specificity phosphatase PhoE
MATTILLARHGETDWNFERRVQGHSDRPLNERGRAQARALADELEGEQIDAVYASDLVRAHETARLVAERIGLGVTVLPELREKNFGSWEGLTDREVLSRFPDAHRGAWGDGETSEDVDSRVVEALHRIAAAHPEGRVLVVAHGGALNALWHHALGERVERWANCAVYKLAVREGEFLAVD